MVDKQATLVKNTLIIALGKLSTQFLSFLLLPLYTSYLTTGEFGTVDLVLTYVFLLAPILTVQLEMASFRFLIEARADDARRRAVVSNVLQMVGKCVLLFIAAFIVLAWFVTIPHGGLIFGAILAAILSGLFLQFARGFGDNIKFSIGSVMVGVITVVANIVLIAGLGMRVEGMLAAMILGNTMGAAYLFATLKLYRYISLSERDKNLCRQLLGYSMPLVPNGIAWWVINAADRTIITILLGVAANGIFAVAYKFPLIFNGLFSFFGMSWTESASMHINSSDRDNFFSQAMNASVRLFGSLGAGMIVLIPLIFNLLVDEAYREAYLYIPILVAGAFLNSIVGLYSAIYIAKKMTKQVASTSIAAAIINIILTIALIKFIGLYAAAIATTIAYLAMAIYRHHDTKKYVKISYEKNLFGKITLLYLMAASFYYFNNVVSNIIIAVVVAIAIFTLNKSVIWIIKDKVMSVVGYKRKSAPEQRAFDESI